MNSTSYREYLEMADSPDAETLRVRLDRFAQRLGFPLSNATCVQDRTDGRRSTVRGVRTVPWSAEWESMSLNHEATLRDPVAQAMRYGCRPLSYDQTEYVVHKCGDLWEEQAPFGFRAGINAVLHLQGGRHFYLGVDGPDPLPRDRETLMRMLADCQLLATFIQDTVMRLCLGEERGVAELDVRLPVGRELEVLKWAAAGKTAWETGMILSISDSTVNKHMSAVLRRLSCTSKAQAIAKAFALGML